MYVNGSAVEGCQFNMAHFQPESGEVIYDEKQAQGRKARGAYLVDSLTQGIYDESTRDFTQYLLLPQVLQFRKLTYGSAKHRNHLQQVRNSN